MRERMGAGTVNAVPHSHYPTKDGKWVAIACTNDKIFGRLTAIMGRMDVTGEGIYGTIAKREARRAEVDAFVSHWTSGMTRDEILAACETGQVPCGPVYAIDEIFNDPQYHSRENIKIVKESRVPGATEFAVPNVVPRLTDTPGSVEWLGPALGAHTEAVLKDWLAMSAAQIAKLRAAGAI